MKIYLSVLLVTVLLNNQCRKGKMEVPACVLQRIEEIKSQPKWNPAAEINEYVYKKQRVFLVTSNCCDQYIMLYDGACTPVCAPGGGITGRGDGKCSDFYESAIHVRLVWKDDR